MSKNNCINRSLKPFKDLKSNISKALGLNDLSISDESLLDVIDMFATDNNLDQDEVLDHIEELTEYIEDYFGVDTKYKPNSTVKELYDEWYTDNSQYINTPYDETKESLEFEEIAKVVTEGTAKTIRLSNGQKMTIIPNFEPVVYYNISPTSVEKTLKNNGLIHSYNDALFVTRKDNKTTQQLKEDIYKELELYGYSRNSVTFKDKFNSIVVEINEPQRKVDFVDAEVNKSMRSIRDVVEFLSEKIPAIKGKVHYNVTVEDATKILKKAGKVYNDGINAFVHNGEIYLIQGKATQDIAIEEALHVLTESLIADNYALASKMLAEAKKLFPQLVDDIKSVYKGGKGEQDREILTQALTRIFRQEFNEGQRQEAESILKRFVNWVRQLFGLNPVTDNIIIELEQLSKDMTLRDFAQLINSSNAEFRTWSHNKTQFNKTTSSYNNFKDVATEEEYEQLLVELELSRDKTDTFLYNFVTKILNVNPKVKLDKSIHLTVQNFRKPDTARIPLDDQEKLPKRIFGVEQSVTLGVDSKSLKNYIELDWESDLIRELEILESTKVRVLDRLYKEKRELEKDIKTINRILKSREYASSEDLKYVEKFLENKNNKRSTYQHLGYELQKLNKNLEAKNTEIKNFIFKNSSKKLAIKNRLAALKTIPDIKELIYQRLVAEKKAYTLPENAWNEHIKPWLELYEKAQKTLKGSKLLKHLNPVFDSIHHLLSEEITIKDLKKGILKVHPEYEELLNLIEQTNPNVVIKVLTDQVYEAFDDNLFGSAGKFSPKTNTVTLRETSDIDTIIHELVHAASYYGLVGSATRQKEDTLEFKVIDPFIKYINDYLKEHVGDFGPVSVWGVKGPASIYGFTNASEFIAELFSNNAFQELLDSIPPMEKKQFNSLLEEIISDIIDFIKEFFGVQTKETALTQAKQLAMAVIRTQQMHSEEIYKQLEDLQDESNLHKILNKKASKKKSLDDYVAEVEEMIDGFNRTVKKDKNFKKYHKYTITIDGKEKPVDISVTKLNEQVLGLEEFDDNDTVYPQGHIGNSFDALVRDYFDLSPEEFASKKYPNLNNKQVESLKKQLDQFKKQLDETFKDGYKVITKDWSLGGKVTIGKKEKLVAGSIDMMVVTNSGDIYIYDMKTTSKDIKDNLKKYRGQLTFYKELITATYPEIGKRIKGIGLLICDINFGNKYGSSNYKAYSLEKNTDQLLFNGEKIQKQPGHINPVIQTTNDAQGGFIRNLDTLNKVEELEKNPLDIVEIKSEEDLVAKELERRIKEEADKAVEKVDTEKLGTLKETVNTDANLEPVSDVEIAYVSKAIMNILSAYVDLLNTNDSYRIKLLSNEDGTNDYAEKYFVDIPREQILTSDVFHKLLTYIRKNHFNYVNRKKEDVYPKLKWINKNFDAIVNAGFARLVTLEKVSLTLTKDVTEENANTALAEAFAKAQREESQRMSYDIDAKEKSYMDSIPARLKTKLNKIYKYEYDEYGNKLGIVSDPFGFGIPEFEDGYYVVNTIMSLVHGCSKLSDMKKELLKHQSEYPFLGDVIEAIFKDRQLKTQFYRTFRKNATLYNKLYRVVERDADGDILRIYYRSQPLSVGVKTDRILDNVNTNMETNTPIVFDKVKNGVVKVNGEQVEKLEEMLKPLMDLRRYKMSEVKEIKSILRKLGFDTIDNPSALANTKYTETTRQLVNNINNLLRLLKKKANLDKPFFYGSELGTSFYYIAKSLTVAMDDTYEISVYDGGKSRMTYTEPTELQTILEILGDKNPSMPFDRIIEEKYKKYAQFYDGKDFTSSWLTELSENPELREVLNHHVRTTFEDTPYLKQNDKEYALSLILDYASPMISGNDYYKGKGDLALFRVPIMSDKNSAESILFKKYAVKYDKPEDGYGINEMKKEITDRAYSFFLQEIKRMKSVYQQLLNDPSGDIEFYHMRDPKAREKFVIKDANGKPKKLKKLTVKDFLELRSEKKFNGFMFSYCPWFNAEMDKSTKLAQYIVDIINGENAPAGFKKLYEKVIKAGLEAGYAKWKDHIENELHISPKMLAASITDITSIPSKKTEGQLTSYDAFMQEYFWNDYLATCNIYHLTIIDPAFNKDTVDLQKRFSQVHSSTIKCDTEATFEDENKVERNFSDGTFRFIILEDLTAASTMAKDVEQIFLKAAEKAEKEGKTKEAKELMLLAKTIPSQYDKIDVSDGQAFSSPTGFWKKLSMLGEFDPEFDKYIMQLKDALDNISKGDFSIRNFNFVKQAFKPFLYGHSPHFESNTDMGKYLVPTQLKDSEAMIVLYGAIMQGADKHSPLTALFKFMENSHWVKDKNGNRVYNDKGIDTIAFHSAVKVGAYGIVDINDLNSEDEVLEALEGAVVHEIPYSAWGKQVENPEHLQDHTQGMGSQQRVLTVSDIPDDAVLVVNGKKYTKEEFLNKYFNNIAKDMRNGIDNVIKKLKLKGNRLERNKALSELLQKAVVKDAKYTDALRRAFTLNDKGEFDIPLGDPMIADKFFSTLFSLVKKNVNLEEFQGGPVVQMSVFGMVDDLQMKYKHPDSKTGLYCEAYMTAPTKELEDRITVTKKNIKEVRQHFGNKYQIGEMLETDDAIELGYMDEKEAWCIFDRI